MKEMRQKASEKKQRQERRERKKKIGTKKEKEGRGKIAQNIEGKIESNAE